MALNRLSQRLTETFKESTRDLPILQGKGPATQTYFEYNDDKLREITQLFDGSRSKASEADTLEGMKRLIAMISKGRDMSAFFPQVVKQVASSSVEIRKLVYIYLLRYAETNSDLLLLSINTFQRDLADSSPLIRSMAIRVLTSIRLSVIQAIVMLGLEKLVHDRNPWVRKTVALGLIKVYDSDSTTLPQLKTMLLALLDNSTSITIGVTLQAVNTICPDNLSILHPYYKRICMLLIDSDEWGQTAILATLQRYVRKFLENPNPDTDQVTSGTGQHGSDQHRASVSGPAESPSLLEGISEKGSQRALNEMDPDLELLLHCTLPLFQSRNPAVTLAAVRLFFLCAPQEEQSEGLASKRIVPPLLRLCSSAPAASGIAWAAWEVAREIAEQRPLLLSDRIEKFFVRSSDSTRIKRHKIAILSCLVHESNANLLIREFKEYARNSQLDVSKEAIQAIVRCSEQVEAFKGICAKVLLSLLKSGTNSTIAQSVTAVRSLVQSLSDRDLASHIVLSLIRRLSFIIGEEARASVYWLGSRYSTDGTNTGSTISEFEGIAEWAPDLLRDGVRCFTSERPVTKIEILNLAAVLLTDCPGSRSIHMLARHALNLGRYDQDWDVRDRARLLAGLLRSVRQPGDQDAQPEELDLGGVTLRLEQIKLVLSDCVDLTQRSDQTNRIRRNFPIASLAGFDNRAMRGTDWDVPPWTTEPTDSSFREIPETLAHANAVASEQLQGAKAPVTAISSTVQQQPPFKPNASSSQRERKIKNLDEFLDETDSDASNDTTEASDQDSDMKNPGRRDARSSNLPPYNATSDSSSSDSSDSESD